MLKTIKVPLFAIVLALGLGGVAAHADGVSVHADHTTTLDLDNVKAAHSSALDAAMNGSNTSVGAGDAGGAKVANKKFSTETNVKVSAPTAAVLSVIGN